MIINVSGVFMLSESHDSLVYVECTAVFQSVSFIIFLPQVWVYTVRHSTRRRLVIPSHQLMLLSPAGIHAREWISPAVALHLIDEMVSDTTSVMQNMDVYAVPVSNPDGYVYSWTTDRMWRKNRRPSLGRQDCPGVDLNRNWETGYGVGASDNPCSEVYKGARAFSEPETQALRDEMKRVSTTGDVRLVLSLHSYGQIMLYPWGWTTKMAPNTDNMKKAGEAFAAAAAEERNTLYSVKNSAEGMYYASGATDDWAKEALRAPYTYTLELPDSGTYAFKLPASHIMPVTREVWRGLQKLLPLIR